MTELTLQAKPVLSTAPQENLAEVGNKVVKGTRESVEVNNIQEDKVCNKTKENAVITYSSLI